MKTRKMRVLIMSLTAVFAAGTGIAAAGGKTAQAAEYRGHVLSVHVDEFNSDSY